MDTLPAPTSSPPLASSPVSAVEPNKPKAAPGKGVASPTASVGNQYLKSTRRKWPAGSIQQWTVPVLSRLSKHFPAAITRIGEIVRDPEHKDNFAACKLVIETLVRDGKTRGPIDGSGIKIVVEMAHGKEEKLVIEQEAEEVT